MFGELSSTPFLCVCACVIYCARENVKITKKQKSNNDLTDYIFFSG